MCIRLYDASIKATRKIYTLISDAMNEIIIRSLNAHAYVCNIYETTL